MDQLGNCGTRAVTSGVVAGGLLAAIAGSNISTSLKYGVRLGAVNFVTDFGMCYFMPNLASSENSSYTGLEYLSKVGGGVVTYAIAHQVAPGTFPYIKGSMFKTALVNATSIYIGGIAGDRIRNKAYSILNLGSTSN